MKKIKYVIALAIAIILSIAGYNWHSSTVESEVREAMSKKEGENKILQQQIDDKVKESSFLIKSRDSALALLKNIKHDTILIYRSHDERIKVISNLGTNSSIELLAKRLSQENTHR